MNELQILNYNNEKIRIVEVNNELWWVLKDVCQVLKISNPTMTASRLDNDEVTKFDLGSRVGITNIINESGLYSVILRSDKPQAKPFKRWVTHEVLPSIRKTGSYSHPQARASDFESLTRRIEALEKEAVQRRVETLENIYRYNEAERIDCKTVEQLPPHIRAAVDCMIDRNCCIGAVLDFLDDNNVWISFKSVKKYIEKRKAAK